MSRLVSRLSSHITCDDDANSLMREAAAAVQDLRAALAPFAAELTSGEPHEIVWGGDEYHMRAFTEEVERRDLAIRAAREAMERT
jgi:hypothetical protein